LSLHGLFAFVDPGTKVWSEWETQLPMQSIFVVGFYGFLSYLWAFCWMQSTQQLKPDPHSPSQSWLWQFVCTTSSFMGHCNSRELHMLWYDHIIKISKGRAKAATMNQHPPVHHPLDARYYSVVDEPQLS